MGHMGSGRGGSSFGPPRGLLARYGYGGLNYGIFGPPVLPEIVFDGYDPNDPFGCDPIGGRRNYFGDDGDQAQDASGGQQPDGSDNSQPQDDGSGGSGGVLDAVQQVASGVADMIAPAVAASAGPSPQYAPQQYAPPPPPPTGYPDYPHPHHHHHRRHHFIQPSPYLPPPPPYIPPPAPRENVWRHMADWRDQRFEARERRYPENYAHPGYYRPAPPFAPAIRPGLPVARAFRGSTLW